MQRRIMRQLAAGLVAALPAAAAAQEAAEGSALEATVRAAQEGTATGEITVTATRTRRDPFDLPQSVRIVTRDDIERSGSFVALRAVSGRDAGVWYDERTSTTVDPIIRGFAGFNLLTLIDGNTLSTLWGEGGFGADDMYGKIDPEIVERIEIIRGPGSALYGSNALGAVINVITRSSPYDFTDEGVRTGFRTKLGFQSAANAATLRAESYGATPSFRWLLGGSARDFDHIRGGGDLGELIPSDGAERNWDFSGELLLDAGRTVRMTVQDVHRYGIKRYYRPTQDNENDREAVGIFYRDARGGDLFDVLEVRAYRQEKEDRRRFFDTNERGVAVTETWQGGITATRDLGGGHVLTAGLALERDEGDSPDDEQFTIVFPGPERRAAPLSTWWDHALFAQDEWRVCDAWSVIASGRYDRMTLETDVDGRYRPPLGNPYDDEIRETVGSVTGGLGAVYRWTENLHVTGNWARGFRQNAPNFGLRQLGDGVLIPGELLDPTTSDNFELGLKGRFPGWRFDVAWYQSFIENWQGDLRDTTFGGRSYLDFDGNGTRDANEGFVKQVEGGAAWVRGVEANVSVQPNAWVDSVSPAWSVWSSFAWNESEVDPTREHPLSEPIRHGQPTRLLVGVRWDDLARPAQGLYVELVADMVDAFDAIPSDRVDTDLAWREDPQDGASPLIRARGGVPGYTLLHLYAGIDLAEDVRLRLGIENLTNKAYRVAHSRMDAPGVNFLASLDVDF